MLKGNRGEWSEIYVFFKLLAEGKLYGADGKFEKMEDVYYPILKILRNKNEGWEYLRNSEIKVVDGKTKKVIAKFPFGIFEKNAKIVFEKIKSQKKNNIKIPEIEEFLQEIKCGNIKANSRDKRDITLVVHDLKIGCVQSLGFSIKSEVGSSSTLFNSSQTTNFTFEIKGNGLSDKDIARINRIGKENKRNKYRKKVAEILSSGNKLVFFGMEDNNFKANLQIIDSKLPEILGNIILYYYSGKGIALKELAEKLEKDNPCNLESEKGHLFYHYKLKNFLTDVALGMTPSAIWQGKYDATGGYIIVKKDGDIICYHIFNRNEFQEYLINSTRLETPSGSKHGFGKIYKEKGKLLIKLNLQVRFM
jgi:type II restriction enzyme